MENAYKTILKGLLGVLTLALSTEQILDPNETNKLLLGGVLTVLTLVYSTEQLINTAKEIANGNSLFDDRLILNPDLTGNTVKLLQSFYEKNSKQILVPRLTSREKEVLTLMSEGLMNKEIANQLGIRENTVKNYVTSILRKLNASVRTEAVVLAIKQGLINVKNNIDLRTIYIQSQSPQ